MGPKEYKGMMDYLTGPRMAGGGRIGFKNGLGPRNKINQLGVGDEILKMYKEGAGTVEIAKKYNLSKDTINRFIKQTNPKLLRTATVSPPPETQ